MTTNKLPPEQAVRLLRAKAAEWERRLVAEPNWTKTDSLGADIALIATLLADHIERMEGDLRHQVEFREDGWTVQHPLFERLDGSLFDCRVNFNHLDKAPALGRYWIEDDGSFTRIEAQGDH